ncbi:uncharacterized protein LOC143845183 isoform X5 [Paroedura picta]|uniref:uncharacterized protein LOC143845183 isoform X5 n=1 Tax=Paroedura picta TaxID=143630 RepID=UPI004056091F
MAQIQVARRAKARSAAAPSWQHHHAGNEVTALSAGHLLFSARRPAAVLPRRSGAVPGLFSSRGTFRAAFVRAVVQKHSRLFTAAIGPLLPD